MHDKRILLGVSGGIAAYKAAELARILRREGADVRVVMTRAAAEFVTELTFEALTGNPVALEMFARRTESAHEHVELGRWADVFVVAPATADVIAKLALGLADDLLSTTALACGAPLAVAPAMNSSMWKHPAVQANVETLTERGAVIVGPAEGDLSCGEKGVGRMSEPGEIAEAVRRVLAGQT
jgi:phosphopantothenoylcysteine decarboxylase/phosphopantothenate--cysteine ligase